MKPDAATTLLRALRVHFVNPVVEDVKSRSWASATFVGARHEVGLRLDGDGAAAAADRFLNGLEERDLDLRDHFLADIRLVAREDGRGPTGEAQIRISIEALTGEAG